MTGTRPSIASPPCAGCWVSPPAGTTRGGTGRCRRGREPMWSSRRRSRSSTGSRGGPMARRGSMPSSSLTRSPAAGSGSRADACAGSGRESPEGVHDDGARRGGAAGTGSRRAAVHGRGPRPALGGGHHVRADLGRLPLSRRGPRCVESAHHRLGDGHPSPDGPRPGGAGHGPDPAPPDGCHSSFGSGLPIYVGGLRPALSRGRRPALDGERGRRLRQRDVRELLRDTRVRAPGSCKLPHPGRRPDGRVRLHRRLVQPAATAFLARLPVAHDVRAVASDRRSHSALRIDDRPRGAISVSPSGWCRDHPESSSPSTEPGQLHARARGSSGPV